MQPTVGMVKTLMRGAGTQLVLLLLVLLLLWLLLPRRAAIGQRRFADGTQMNVVLVDARRVYDRQRGSRKGRH